MSYCSAGRHVKKGLQMKMSRGELVGFHGCLGYDVDRESKTLVVNPKEAEIVKYIFQRYVEGVGTSMISHELEKLGWKTKKGSTKWAPAVLRGILKIQWGCMKKTLSGKESCPHSKALDEDAIKKAFVESYSIICRNNEKVVDELMGYVQEFFESHDLAAKVANLQKELEKMRRKRDRLINMRMDDLIGEIEYKSKYHEVCDKVAELEKAVYKANKVLGQGKSGIKKRLEGIHKILENPKDMMDFNQDVFEAVIEKIIIGEEKEDGTVDPYRIIFIYKTGFQDELDSRRFKKGRGSAEGTATTTDGILDAQEMSQKQNIEVEDLSQKQEVDTGVFALAQMTGGYENCIETGMCICPTWAYAHPFFMSDCSPSHSHALSDGDNPRG